MIAADVTPAEALDALERLLAAATPGEWTVGQNEASHLRVPTRPHDWFWTRCNSPADAAAIAHLHNLAPLLIEVARMTERVDRIYEGLRTDANDGEFALWAEDDLVRELHALAPALAALARAVEEAGLA